MSILNLQMDKLLEEYKAANPQKLFEALKKENKAILRSNGNFSPILATSRIVLTNGLRTLSGVENYTSVVFFNDIQFDTLEKSCAFTKSVTLDDVQKYKIAVKSVPHDIDNINNIHDIKEYNDKSIYDDQL